MKDLIKIFKNHVISESKNPNFIHHKWFIKYHLEIVEKITEELLDFYPDVDKDIVRTMVWLHDYGKILDFDNQAKVTLIKGKEKLLEIGFPKNFVEKVIEYVKIMDKKKKINISLEPIEIQIISSADGASHFIGPFFSIHRHENPGKDIEELQISKVGKLKIDWDRKITLPEVREKFERRYKLLIEQSGFFPDKYL